MKIKTEDFKKAISCTKYALTKNRIDKKVNVFIFNEDMIYTINSECCIINPLKSGINATIPSDLLIKVMNNYNDEEVDLSYDKNSFTIKGETQKSGIASINFDLSRFPSIDYNEIMDKKDWIPLPENFNSSLNFCSFSTSKDFNMGTLSYVYIDNNSVVSFAGIRGTKCLLSSELGIDFSFLIYYEDARTIASLNPTHVMIDNAIHFKNKDGIYIRTSKNGSIYGYAQRGEMVDVNFISSLFTGKGEFKKIIIPLELKDKILNTKVFTSDLDFARSIKVYIYDGKIRCEGKNEFGFHSVTENLEYEGDPISFSIHPDHFSLILQQERECKIYNNKLVFEADNFIHILSNEEKKD